MPGIAVVTAFAMALLGGGPLWPDLNKLPEPVGGGEHDAAVVIAVEDYVFLPDVVGASELGVAWYMYLSKVRQVPLVLFLRDSEATANKIRDAVEKATKRVEAGGRVWFVFIGHGTPSKDGKDGQLVGATAQADEMDFFPHTVGRSEILATLGTAASGVLPPVLVLDACFSGTDSAGATLIKGAQFVVAEDLTAPAEKPATLMTAGRSRDIAGPLPGETKPAFSYLVLGALRGWGDANRDGSVTAGEAVQYAQDALMSLEPGRMQEPQRSGVDQPLTVAPAGTALESGPDLAAIRLALGGPASATQKGASELELQLAELAKAKQQREEAERREAAAKQAAATHHQAEVDARWADVMKLAGAGGPEGAAAVELFLTQFASSPFGNPREQEARQLLAKMKASARQGVGGYVLVKPGAFLMGRAPKAGEDEDDLGDEPEHEVFLTRAFWLKATEVTQTEWVELMGNQPSEFTACGGECPAENLSWWDAIAYLNKLSEKEGLEQCYELEDCEGKPGRGYVCDEVRFVGLSCRGYRLPTEAEWEFAATAGGTVREPEAGLAGWIADNAGKMPHPVATKEPNPLGFYDMIGNVWEWCWDYYHEEYYITGAEKNPLGPPDGKGRVYRGGSWRSTASDARAQNRNQDLPTQHNWSIGLRPARSE